MIRHDDGLEYIDWIGLSQSVCSIRENLDLDLSIYNAVL